MDFPLLSFIVWLPMGSLLLLLLVPADQQRVFRLIALGTVLLQGLGVGYVLVHGTAQAAGLWVESCPWMRLGLGSWGTMAVDYRVGVDGLNAGLLALTVVVLAMGIVASWNVQRYVKAYFALYLLLDTLVMGSFLALDFLLFYVFFEMALLPVYFFIGLWGGEQGRQAATKFLLYTLLGTVLILVVLIGAGLSVYDPVATGMQLGLLVPGEALTPAKIAAVQSMVHTATVPAEHVVHSLNLLHMQDGANFLPGTVLGLVGGGTFIGGYAARLLAFVGLFVGFGIKMAAVPFHTWLPDAHVAAPTPISMVLAGILLKMGAYGLLRTAYSIFPEGALYYQFEIGLLGVLSIIYAALNALAMQDLKRMVAYASVASMASVLLGVASLTAEGVCGALYQMISHGLLAVLLFGVVGVLDDRVGDRSITHYSGLARIMPCYAALAVLSLFVALGLPGFIGEFLVLLGAFQAADACWPQWLGMAGALGILLNAAYWLWTVLRLFWGRFALRFPDQARLLQDLTVREYLLLMPLLCLLLLLGIFPHWLLGDMADTVDALVTRVHTVGQAHLAAMLQP